MSNKIILHAHDLDGYLTKEDIAFPPAFPEGHVDFDAVRAYKLPLLKKAAKEFLLSRKHRTDYRKFMSTRLRLPESSM